jgi:hypothetical protein
MNDRDIATELHRVGCALSVGDVTRLRLVARQDSTAGLEPLDAVLRKLDGDAATLLAAGIDTSGILPGVWARARFTSYALGPMDDYHRWHVVLTPPIPTHFGTGNRAQVVYLCGRSANLDIAKPAGAAGWFWIETWQGDWPAGAPGCHSCLTRAIGLGWTGR